MFKTESSWLYSFFEAIAKPNKTEVNYPKMETLTFKDAVLFLVNVHVFRLKIGHKYCQSFWVKN